MITTTHSDKHWTNEAGQVNSQSQSFGLLYSRDLSILIFYHWLSLKGYIAQWMASVSKPLTCCYRSCV